MQRRTYRARCSSSAPMPAAILSPICPAPTAAAARPSGSIRRPAHWRRDRPRSVISAGRPDIGAGEHAGIAVGVGKHRPDDSAAGGDADIKADSWSWCRYRLPAARRSDLKLQFTLRCEPTTRPMLADSEHVSVPTWMRLRLRVRQAPPRTRQRRSSDSGCRKGSAKHVDSPLSPARPAGL